MKKERRIFIDEGLLQKTESELENFGLDAQTAVKMLFTRICKEKSIAFLFSEVNQKRTDFKEELISPVHRASIESNQEFISRKSDYKQPIDSTPKLAFGSENFDNDKMTKSRAIRLFIGNGTQINRGAITFASKNRGAYNYWANVSFEFLNEDWSLILNDLSRRKLYLFNIPAYSIKESQLVGRSDRPYLIDLQIMYNDITFTDNRSGLSFKPYYVESINY